jgi:hypothetical protein
MVKQFISLTLIIVSYVANGQNPEVNYNNQLKLSAFQAINILNPGVEIGYERLHSNRLSSQLTVGFATNMIGKPFEELEGYNIGLEEKYFLSKKSKSARYISLALNHNDSKYQERTSGPDPAINLTVIDTFTIARKATSVAFKYGVQFCKNHFVLDVNLGAGLKYRTVKHYDRTLEYRGPREPFDFHRAANMERKGIGFHLPVNIQLGYRF